MICVAVAIALCGCGNADTDKKPEETKEANISCKEVLNEVLKDAEGVDTDSTLFYEEERYEELFEYLYDTSPDRAADGAYAYASSSYADEISIILATEEDDVSVIEKHLEDRIERRVNDFRGYEPDEVEKLNNAVIDTNGNYVIMVVATAPQDIVDEINEILDKEVK